MIAFYQVVSPFPVDVLDAVEMWIISVIDLTNDAPVCLGLVRADRGGAMQAHTLYRLVQKGLSRLCIPSCGQAKIDHLTVCIDGTPQVSPLPADTDVGLIDMPIDAGAPQVLFCSFGQLRTELLNPALHR